MKKIVLLLILSISFLIARDNPFEPVVSSKNIGMATNLTSTLKSLKIQKIKLPSSVRVLKKVTFKVLNVDGSVSDLSYKVNKKVDWHRDIILSNSNIKIEKISKKISPKNIKVFKFLSFLVNGNTIFIKSKDKMIREMFFAKPYKIAIDFKRDVSFYTKIIRLKKSPFVSIVVGNHGDFYRIVLNLDGEYRYKITKNMQGYFVKLF